MSEIDKQAQIKKSLENFKRLLFYTDFSKEADAAFQTALEMAGYLQLKEILLLHVIPESESQFWKTYIYEIDNVDSKAKKDIDNHIDQVYKSTIKTDIKLNVNYRIGNPSQEIIDFAASCDVDLIVIGKKIAPGITGTFFANVAEKVVKKAPCSVFVITSD